ncbi:pseudaminic acid synthase [Patescibacteria group bacterium]|nr:pseudaminic acid synthase [Patescibacteria group bacterium]
MNLLKIGNKYIGEDHPIFVIAEISGNHNQSFSKAKKIVEEACKAGVDAIKLQTYTADTLTIDCDNKWFQVGGTNKEWQGQTLYSLYKKAYTPWQWQPKLQKIAKKYGVILFSTPFDSSAVDFLEKMKVPAYKVASFEIGDLELLKKIGSTKKPVIISRGMANLEEIKLAVKTLKNAGASSVAVLHCVSSYPADPEEMNISTIPLLQKKLKTVIGISDHNLDSSVTIGAVALGAKIVEKHITLKRTDGGPDAVFSLEPKELKDLVKAIRIVEKSLGKPQLISGERESTNLIFRRSLFVIKDVKKGDKLSSINVRCIRPGYGMSPKFLNKVLGKKFKKDVKKGTPLSWNFIK